MRGPVFWAAQEARATGGLDGRQVLPSRSGLLGRRHLCSRQWPREERSPSRAQPRVSGTTGAPYKRRLCGFAASSLKLFTELGRPSPRCWEGAEPPRPAWPRPALRAPARVEPAPGAASGRVRARGSATRRPQAIDRLRRRDHAPPPSGVGDQREGGAAARPRERRRQLARRGVPGLATSGALRAQRRGHVKVKAQRRPRAVSTRRPKSKWSGTRRRARAARRWGQILRCPCTLRPSAPGSPGRTACAACGGRAAPPSRAPLQPTRNSGPRPPPLPGRLSCRPFCPRGLL